MLLMPAAGSPDRPWAPSAAFPTAFRGKYSLLSAGGKEPGHGLCCSSSGHHTGLPRVGAQLPFGAARAPQAACGNKCCQWGWLSFSLQWSNPAQDTPAADQACNILLQHIPGCVTGAMGMRCTWHCGNAAGTASHQPQQAEAPGTILGSRTPPGLFHSSCQVYTSLRKEYTVTTCL